MGQYFEPILFDDDYTPVARFNPRDFDNGKKLCEHCYVGNNLIENVVSRLNKRKYRLVWIGDYAKEYAIVDNYIQSKGITQANESPIYANGPCFFVNHSKSLYFDIQKQKTSALRDSDILFIHPLPILTCSGNGKSSSDYNSNVLQELVGDWAYDLISVEDKAPSNYIEIFPWFTFQKSVDEETNESCASEEPKEVYALIREANFDNWNTIDVDAFENCKDAKKTMVKQFTRMADTGIANDDILKLSDNSAMVGQSTESNYYCWNIQKIQLHKSNNNEIIE